MVMGPVRFTATTKLQIYSSSGKPKGGLSESLFTPQSHVRFSASEKAAVTDANRFERLPRIVQNWIKRGLLQKFDPTKPTGPIGFDHLLLGLMRSGAKAVENISDLEADPWTGKPADIATLRTLISYLHGINDIEDEEPQRDVLWELFSNAAASLESKLKSETRTAPSKAVSTEPGIRFTPDLRKFVDCFLAEASSLLPTGNEFFDALIKNPKKAESPAKSAKKPAAESASLKAANFVRLFLSSLGTQYEEMLLRSGSVDKDQDKDTEASKDSKVKSKPGVTVNAEDAEEMEELKTAPYGEEYFRWKQKLRDLSQLPQAQQGFTARQFDVLEQALKRFRSSMPEEAGEPANEIFQMQFNHAEALLELPWKKAESKPINLKKIKAVLNADHYGLEKPKQDILDYMSVEARRQEKGLPGQGKIVLFLGPRGIGKTSLARSIARAIDRPFASIALGGMKEASEIRGDRRAFIQAEPGKFVKAIREAGAMNPVLLLDELDKIESPAVKAALLEALDPEQNSRFRDHMVGEYDLSQVLAICTANSLENVPPELMSRLEIIPLRPYTTSEKLQIAKQHLLPKVMKKNCLSSKEFRLPDETIKAIIDHYAPEPGVRELERRINTLCAKRVFELTKRKAPSPSIQPKQLFRYFAEMPPRLYQVLPSRVGRTHGLDGSDPGGLLPIDVTIKRNFLGKNRPNELKLKSVTGGLGTTARDSVKKVIAYVETHSEELSKKMGVENLIEPGNLINVNMDIGGEFSAGPCEGPSAGAALTTALISSLSGIPVRGDVAMTGTLSQHGDIGAIGGLINKLSGALRSGAKIVLAPRDNLSTNGKNVIEGGEITPIPEELLEKLKIIPVKHFNEVIRHVYDKKPASSS